MAEIKYKFDYIAPENVECQVPGKQKLRQYDSNSAIVKATVWDEDKIDTPEDYILAPVVTVTKNEATLTKGDMKLQMVSVTENISEIRNGVFHTLKAPSYPPIHSDVIHETPIRRMDHTSQSEAVDQGSRPIRRRVSLEAQNTQSEERRTRIPTRFKAAVNRVRRERSMPAKNINETLPTHPRRSSIPRLKPKAPSPKPEDEFERLYGEIANSPTDIDISLLNNKVDDPEKVEDCFEEIIHAYDENKIQPVAVEFNKHNNENKLQPLTVEKPKQSKIPMLKRKSEAEIDVPKSVQANTKVSNPPGDKSRLQDTVSKISKSETNENKFPTRISVTKRVNVDSDNLKLKTAYQSVKSMSRDRQKHEIQVENIVKVSLEQNIGPDHVINIDNLKPSKPMESTIDIVEITPVEDSSELANKITVQPDSVEIVELPTSTIVEELQNDSIKFEEATQNEPMADIFKADNTLTQINIPIDPVKVISVEENQNLVHANSKENKIFKPVLEVERNGNFVDSDNDISKFSESRNMEKEIINTTPSQIDRKFSNYGNDEKIPRLLKTTRLDSNNEEEDNAVKHKSVLSKIAMFELHRQDERLTSIKPKPAVRCSYRRRFSEEKVSEVLEPEKNTANPKIDKDFVTDDASDQTKPNPPTSRIPEPQTITNFADSKPIIVSEVIKSVESNLFTDSINNKTNNTVEIETTNYEVNNNVVKSQNLRISKMEIREVKVGVSNAIEKNIFENQTVVSESKEDVITHDITGDERIKRHHPNRYYSFEVDYSRKIPEIIEKPNPVEIKSITPVDIEYVEPLNSIVHEPKSNDIKVQDAVVINHIYEKPKFELARRDPKESPFDFTPKTLDHNSTKHKISPIMSTEEILNSYKAKHEDYNLRKAKSVAEIDLGNAVKGKVQDLIVRMKSVDKSVEKKEVISVKERPREKSVMEKIALFEGVFTHGTVLYTHSYALRQVAQRQTQANPSSTSNRSEDEYQNLLDELKNSKQKYGTATGMPKVTLSNGAEMPVMAVGTALLDPRLAPAIIASAIDLGYRAIDTASIYGNEKAVGEGIKQKIADGTVKREELFVIAKLWSTSHRRDLVEKAYKQSLASLGLEYVDLYLIHNPMSFKEGPNPIPMISRVVQYSEHDYLDAWYGMEDLVAKGLVKSIGLSNFNSSQVQKILDKARFKPVINQVECHPYLSQERLHNFCDERNIKLSCFGVLGSKGTPPEHKNTTAAAIDDPMVQIMAAGLNVSPAQLLIRYQLQSDHAVVVKASTGAHMWDNLQALKIELSEAEMNALRALNRNKRAFVFKGMGDTHKNYPFNAPF